MKIIKDRIFWLVMAASLILRIAVINKPFWIDESISLYISRLPLDQIIPYLLRGCDVHLPLWNLIMLGLITLCNSYLFVRAFSLSCGLILIWGTYSLGKDIFNRKAALIAASLLALSPGYIYNSVEMRIYSFWAMSSVFMTISFLKLMEEPGKVPLLPAASYIFSALLCLYSHYFTVFLLIAQLLVFILYLPRAKNKTKSFFWVYGTIFLFSLPQVYYFYLQSLTFSKWSLYYIWSQRVGNPFNNSLAIFYYYAGAKSTFLLQAAIILLVLFISLKRATKYPLRGIRLDTLIKFLSPTINNYRVNLLFLLFLAPFAFLSVGNLMGRNFYHGRYFIPFMVPYFLILGGLFSSLKGKTGTFFICLLLGISLLSGLRYVVNLRAQPKLDFDSIASAIQSKAKPQDTIAVSNLLKYFHLFNLIPRPVKVVADPQQIINTYILTIFDFKDGEVIIRDTRALKNGSRIWVVNEPRIKATERVKWIDSDERLQLREKILLKDAEIECYEVK
ncbi:MAG TPA: glycosyltransferase family 39 protein [Candidatus Margulisiibacteriota bacterium]|nr:glycosyltransferase family 39 protein [Candidatus Margulisiibacteriota bacterium]